ncbi:hypothetical protein ACSBPU_09255 [Parapusillimonas sp. JC17]|uniref:hypothetical protein n=1 Tax=Parapusillimonas sp. JC17 TaxID=3445768 RepID=UPI003FA08DA8
MERKILRRMPWVIFFGGLLIALPSIVVRLIDWDRNPLAAQALIERVDMFAFGTGMLFFNAVFAVTTGAVLIVLMKGPGYVADGYKLSDADSPRRVSERD